MNAVRTLTGFELALANGWQRRFPLQREPFAAVAKELRCSAEQVVNTLKGLMDDGVVSRVGGVFTAHAGGAGLLAAMAVPPQRLASVAAIVDQHPGVNHNYEREHAVNLWFVLHGASPAEVEASLEQLEACTGLAALRLPMQRAYRIDLGFDLQGRVAGEPGEQQPIEPPPVAQADRPLAALAEAGLPLLAQPYDQWATRLGCSTAQVLSTLARWQREGTLRRFGVVVRHHELGFVCNAMCVFDVPDDRVDAAGAELARVSGVTLAYRRARAPCWPYNLYAMVHGRDRDAVAQVLDELRARCGLQALPQAVLYSRRRFKQQGAARFRELQRSGWAHAA